MPDQVQGEREVVEVGQGGIALVSGSTGSVDYSFAEYEPANVRRLYMQGARQWEETMLLLDDLFFVHERRRECGAQHGHTVADNSGTVLKCNIRMDMLLRREGARICRIVFVDVGPVKDSDVSFCWPYAKCLGKARVGELLPCPDADGEGSDYLAIRQVLQALHQPTMFDAEFVGRLIEDHERVRAGRPLAEPDHDYRRAYLRRVADRYLEYLRWHHQQLQARD